MRMGRLESEYEVRIDLANLTCLNSELLTSLLCSSPLVFLGKLSFGIYLVHYPILIYYLGSNATSQQLLHTRMVSCQSLSRNVSQEVLPNAVN